MHLARALKSAGQPARAVDVYKSLLQLQPDHPTAHFKLGSVLRHMGRHEAAAEAYRCACTYTHMCACWRAARSLAQSIEFLLLQQPALVPLCCLVCQSSC